MLGNPEHYRYFFDRLNNPEWIEPLWGKGYFQQPPPPILDPLKNTISFPPWPEAFYLVRMAKELPTVVLNTLLKMPDIDNASLHSEFCHAACQMPVDAAVQWAKKETKWIAKHDYLYWGLPESVAKLVSHLAKGNQTEAALSLTAAMLAVLPDTSTQEQRQITEGFSKPLEPRIRMDAWEYGEILKKHVPDLLAVTPDKTFSLLCDLLGKAVEYSTDPKCHADKFDYSFIWRPAIEENEQNTKFDQPRDSLVEAVRDVGEKLVREEAVQLPVIVQDVERRGWSIFKRIALHLLRVFPDKAPDLLAARLTNQNYYEAGELRHEYALLTRESFGRLQPDQQQIILRWIDGIKVTEDKEREAYRRFMGKEPPPEMITPERTAKIRKLNRLQPIRDSLSADWRAKYDQWAREVGHEPEHPEFVTYHSSWTGPTSPKSADDLKQMPVEQVVSYLREWKPPGGHYDPSPEGLARTLTAAVTADPTRFATAAYLFRDLDPTYVCGFFYGLREPVASQKQALPWEQVLKLCEWVVEQPREIPGRKADYDTDTGWGWTRKAIADLLEMGMNVGVAEIPYANREIVWRIIEPLTDDPDPTVEAEAKYGGDPMNYSINTARGHAMHAVMQFGVWVRRNLEQAGQTWRGFEEIPQARKVLDAHLKPEEHSLAIRSVYGRRFSWLLWLDESWVRSNVERILPQSEATHNYFNAVWDAYVVCNWPTKEGFRILEQSYGMAIDQLPLQKPEGQKFSNPDQWLAAHMMLVYGRADIGLEHDVLRDFYQKAPDAVRAEAMAFVGRSLKEQLPAGLSEVVPRFVKLWDWRFATARQSENVETYREELAAFGGWFACGKFEDGWVMEQLLEVLRLVKKAGPDHLVMDRLVETAAPMPEQTVECLRLKIEGNQDYWKFYSWRDESRKILGTAIQSNNPVAREKAIELVHRLGAMGHFEYRGLLPAQPSEHQ